LALGVAVQLTVLLGMIGMRAAILVSGEAYFVPVQPVDPRDLLRGDFVILSYEFSRLPHDGRVDGTIQRDRMAMNGRDVYVSLTRDADGKHMRATRFSLERPGQGTYLKGTLNEFGQITYGIESYFVQEGKGHVYEEAIRSRGLSAEISVTPDGVAAIRALHIAGK
jgi:uncharacterized membrane-anchored protein